MKTAGMTGARKMMALAAWLFIVASSSLAQAPSGQDPVGENLFPPELVMAHQKEIGLTDAQKTFLRAEILRAQTRFTELQWQLQDNMETLVGLLKENPTDEDKVVAQLDKVLSAEREIKRAQIALMVRIKNKLAPEQQTRLRQVRSEASTH
jgi:Spy/CpxP family protein refolding chaperone